MIRALKNDAYAIIKASIEAVQPDDAVKRALQHFESGGGRTILVAVGKAAWQMANAAVESLGGVDAGIVITKYGHVKEEIPAIICCEAGHPVPDRNGVSATEKAINLVKHLCEKDTVIFLLSGGGSALFEMPLIPMEELQDITKQLLAYGADIIEINTIRKRLSAVKGGRFAQKCYPAKVFSVVLSDILGDPLDMIASGPAYPDSSTSEQAMSIAKKYNLRLSESAWDLLTEETPKKLSNVTTVVTGSVRELCNAAAAACESLGYKPVVLTDMLSCQAKEAGSFLASIARTYASGKEALAFLAGGETIVHVTGKGKGGRNQELALSAAADIDGLENVLVFSLGSDGTDGPTDAAGGIVDGTTAEKLRQQGFSIHQVLKNNDAYHALAAADALIFTGPTGTNVNDISVVLIR